MNQSAKQTCGVLETKKWWGKCHGFGEWPKTLWNCQSCVHNRDLSKSYNFLRWRNVQFQVLISWNDFMYLVQLLITIFFQNVNCHPCVSLWFSLSIWDWFSLHLILSWSVSTEVLFIPELNSQGRESWTQESFSSCFQVTIPKTSGQETFRNMEHSWLFLYFTLLFYFWRLFSH